MNEIVFTSAKYQKDSFTESNVSIKAVTKQVNEEGNVVDTEIYVPIDENNRHYKEILRQVDAGTLTVAEAD